MTIGYRSATGYTSATPWLGVEPGSYRNGYGYNEPVSYLGVAPDTGSVAISKPAISATGTFTVIGTGSVSIAAPAVDGTGDATGFIGSYRSGIFTYRDAVSYQGLSPDVGAIVIAAPALASVGTFSIDGTGAETIAVAGLSGTGNAHGFVGSYEGSFGYRAALNYRGEITGPAEIAIAAPEFEGVGSVAEPTATEPPILPMTFPDFWGPTTPKLSPRSPGKSKDKDKKGTRKKKGQEAAVALISPAPAVHATGRVLPPPVCGTGSLDPAGPRLRATASYLPPIDDDEVALLVALGFDLDLITA